MYVGRQNKHRDTDQILKKKKNPDFEIKKVSEKTKEYLNT